MGLRRPDGVTWSVLVNGEVPWESENLRGIFDEAIVVIRRDPLQILSARTIAATTNDFRRSNGPSAS